MTVRTYSSCISKPIPKLDNHSKLSGSANYVADLCFEGMLFAKTIRSTKAKARIMHVEIPPLPEGYYVIDRHDIPGKNIVKMIYEDQPFLANEIVNYVGEPILLVVGPDKEKILSITQAITIIYEELPMEQAPFVEYTYKKGNVDTIFGDASYVIEDEYKTGYQEQLYIEPQGVIAVPEGGRMYIYGSLQCPYYVKDAVAQGLGWEGDRISVNQTVIGGAFGGKEDYPSIIAGHAAFAAQKTGKPVQLIFDRNEDIISTPKRHPSVIRYKTAINERKQILGMVVEVEINAGAYSGLSNVVLQRSMFAVTGVYDIPNLYVEGKAMRTNTVPSGAFRGFGAPQSFFAIERHMDNVARKLSIDPLEWKQKYMAKQGGSTATGGTFIDPIKLPEMIEMVDQMANYSSKRKSYEQQNDRVWRGVGMSLFLHGCGFTGSGEQDYIKAKAKLRKSADGTVEILVANVDMGQGLKTTFSKIVAQALELPIEQIIYENPNTDRVPNSGPTVASRSIMIVGGLLERAAIELKERWNESDIVEVMKQYRQPEHIRWNDAKFEGDAYPTYSWGVNVVEVEVDPVTYEATTKGVWGVYDIGTAIDERIIMGQIEGGVVQGLGYASIEVMKEKQGQLLQKSMTDYKVPTVKDVPIIESKLIDNYYGAGPFGAKGAGELTLIGAAPAYAQAVEQAIARHVTQIPITPEYIMEVIEDETADTDLN
ncbi:aldehyde oxidase [Desulfuribacillus stibiiarsenatis]|uniref:Aldehyde oxidase n=1 Tax=Desulfuribacillus stibiiarsenatis TaxID=1390249 RepID=A0A1E5L5C9_9FIRM|nr:xanthine dehydrogenase family protein molybdopterin-binding subunit [Desulfuribacillus stibiiarsenatis]OEH85320.1 aldehyde oxidase [Desulfuribacillus stibiiarsenatis]